MCQTQASDDTGEEKFLYASQYSLEKKGYSEEDKNESNKDIFEKFNLSKDLAQNKWNGQTKSFLQLNLNKYTCTCTKIFKRGLSSYKNGMVYFSLGPGNLLNP